MSSERVPFSLGFSRDVELAASNTVGPIRQKFAAVEFQA
jgi:hypothetical protein